MRIGLVSTFLLPRPLQDARTIASTHPSILHAPTRGSWRVPWRRTSHYPRFHILALCSAVATRVTTLQTPFLPPSIQVLGLCWIPRYLACSSVPLRLRQSSFSALRLTSPVTLNDIVRPPRQDQSTRIQANTYYSQAQLPFPTTTYSIDYPLIHICPWHSSQPLFL